MKIDIPALFAKESRSFDHDGRHYDCKRVLPYSVKVRFADSSGRQCAAVIEPAAPRRGGNPAHPGRLTSLWVNEEYLTPLAQRFEPKTCHTFCDKMSHFL